MKENIPVEILKSDTAKKTEKREILKGEIEGVKTFFNKVCSGESVEITSDINASNIFLVLSGKGSVSISSGKTVVDGMSIYIPGKTDKLIVSADSELEFIQIVWQLTADEFSSWKQNAFPYCLKYNEAKTYKEAIKSPKTVNRTLVHEDLIPRFCMGSVETEGPDAVGAHRHPMLEQHFFGLNDNYCYVKADENEVLFPGRALLHIPLGSEHSVRVEEGKKLHYVWIDYFRDAAGVEWIKKMHKSDE